EAGVLLHDAGSNTVGGAVAGAGNVITSNHAGILIVNAGATANLIAANLIGTSADGSEPLGNTTDGIAIAGAPGNLIGGTSPGAGNTIGGNAVGVHISGQAATGNVLRGNSIGTSSAGVNLVRNSQDGIAFDAGASNNSLGGTVAGAANTVAYDQGSG